MRRFIPLIVLLSLLAPSAKAQWKIIHTFDSIPRVIYFLDDVGAPETGFVGLYNGELWRTSDVGTTWTQCPLPSFDASIACIVFKNSLIGWAGTKGWGNQKGGGPLLATTDGGISWTTSGIFGESADINYHAATNLLFLSQWFGVLESGDNGQTWVNINSQEEGDGISFASDTSGIITDCAGGPTTLMLTNDGGITWTTVPRPAGAWQTAPLPNSNIYYLTSEYSDGFYISTDDGQTWSQTYKFPGFDITGPTGCTRVTSCGQIYVQSIYNGFYESEDSGHSWRNIGGPNGIVDSRFAIANGSVYAADEYGELYRYPIPGSGPSTIVLSSNSPLTINAIQCDTIPSTLQFYNYSPCAFTVDSLLSVTFTGSPSLSLRTTPKFPSSMATGIDDSVIVIYDPAQSLSASGILTLTFSINGVQKDTTISISASNVKLLNPSTPFLRFAHGTKQANLNIPDTIPLWLCLSGAVPSGAVLDSIAVTMTFDGDVISPVYVDGLEGFQVENWQQNGNMLNFTLLRSVRDSLLADSAIAQIGFQSFVSRNSYSPIHLTRVVFDTASQLTDNCSFAIASVQDSLLVNINPACPDSILRMALDGNLLLSDFSVVPNPSENHTSAWFSLSGDASVTIELTDALGRKCGNLSLQTLLMGEHSINIDLPNESGIYFLSLEANTAGELQSVRQTRTIIVLQ